jgi:hypothetical protein
MIFGDFAVGGKDLLHTHFGSGDVTMLYACSVVSATYISWICTLLNFLL